MRQVMCMRDRWPNGNFVLCVQFFYKSKTVQKYSQLFKKLN